MVANPFLLDDCHDNADLRRKHVSPRAAVYAYAEQVACLAETPSGFAHHMDYLKAGSAVEWSRKNVEAVL